MDPAETRGFWATDPDRGTKDHMTGPATSSLRTSLELRIAGEGVSLRDLAITELARILSAAAALVRAVAEDLQISASDPALVALEEGSVALRFEAVRDDAQAEEAFDVVTESVHEAIRSRGEHVSSHVRIALGRLYDSCRLGPLEVAGSARNTRLENILMAQPMKPTAMRVNTASVLHGRVEGVLFVKTAFEVIFKPEDGGARLHLLARRALADQAARLFGREARAHVRFARRSDGESVDWVLQSITRWEPRNLLDVLAKVGDELHEQGFDVDSARFEQSLREHRRDE
jgi:hypothetical protein